MTQADDELLKIINELKTLEIDKRKKQKHRENIVKSLSECDQDLARIHEKINRVKARVRDPIVTEHAILRYLQRVEGRSLTEVIRTILPPEMAKTIKVLGSGLYTVGDFQIRVKDGIVVTVLKEGEENEETDI